MLIFDLMIESSSCQGYQAGVYDNSQYWVRSSTADFLTSSLVFIFGDSYK